MLQLGMVGPAYVHFGRSASCRCGFGPRPRLFFESVLIGFVAAFFSPPERQFDSSKFGDVVASPRFGQVK